ncbi:MAG: serpin family protein [Planctomycetes bacterium]|nr:serpin family protein [Planctomycetota bacterium]
MPRPLAPAALAAALTLTGAAMTRADEAEARSARPRARAAVDPGDLAEVGTTHLRLASDLLRVVPDRGNVVCSPWSIVQALGMTSAGARGETLAEMQRALHLAEQARLHRLLGGLDRALMARGQKAPPAWRKDARPFTLRSANALWAQEGKRFEPAFLDGLAEHYGAGVRLVDFAADPDAARDRINGWVAAETRDRIRNLLREVSPATRLVLVNAVYFLADWEHPFDPSSTRPRPFTRLDGSKVDAPTMHDTTHLALAEHEGVRAVVLPYMGGEVEAWVLLPPAGKLDATASSLHEVVPALARAMTHEFVSLALPKFEVGWRLAMKDALEALGMRKAFVFGQADFSGMDGTRDLFIGAVTHQAWIAVDEKGTEAAAATAVEMLAGGVPPPPVPFVVDRPFLLLVRDKATGAVLFVTRVEDPTAK